MMRRLNDLALHSVLLHCSGIEADGLGTVRRLPSYKNAHQAADEPPQDGKIPY